MATINYTPGQILYIKSTEDCFYISIIRSMHPHPVCDDDNRCEINTCCDLSVDVYSGEMYPASITFARGGNGSTFDLDGQFDEIRPAHDFEKKLLFDSLVHKFKLHDPKWMHLTDSMYFDILDWLAWEFEVETSDDGMHQEPIEIAMYEIQDYIWDTLCKETGNYQEETTEPKPVPEMVNTQEFIEKACKIYRRSLIKFNPALEEFPTAVDEAVKFFRKQLEE